MVVKTQTYTTSDGAQFPTMAQAKQHEEALEKAPALQKALAEAGGVAVPEGLDIVGTMRVLLGTHSVTPRRERAKKNAPAKKGKAA